MSMDHIQLDFPEFDPITFNDVQYDDSGQNAEVIFFKYIAVCKLLLVNYILIAPVKVSGLRRL